MVASELEKSGHCIVIFPPTWGVSVYRFMERLTEGIALRDFSHRHAAVAVGLGKIGWHGLCTTPQCGTRVRWCSIRPCIRAEQSPTRYHTWSLDKSPRAIVCYFWNPFTSCAGVCSCGNRALWPDSIAGCAHKIALHRKDAMAGASQTERRIEPEGVTLSHCILA